MDDASLRLLKCTLPPSKTPVSLSPPFNKAVRSYTCIVPPTASALTVTASPAQSDAFAQVQKIDSSGSVSLSTGENTVMVKVDAADGSSVSEYQISVLRPAANDTTVKDIKVEPGVTLEPAPSRLETQYQIHVGQRKRALLSLDFVNPDAKAKPVIGTPDQKGYYTLNHGNTPVVMHVSAEGAECEYKFLFSRDSPGFRMNRLQDPVTGASCAVCTSVAFKPVACACGHVFCGACWAIFSPRHDQTCFFCTSAAAVRVSEQDTNELEKRVAGVKLCCVHCTESVALDAMDEHLDAACATRAGVCVDCGSYTASKADGGLFKHAEGGCIECPDCKAKVAKTEQAFHRDIICPKKYPLPSQSNLSPSSSQPYKCQPWESQDAGTAAPPSIQEIREKLVPGYVTTLASGSSRDMQTAFAQLEAGYSAFFTAYAKKKHDITETSQEADHHVFMGLLQEEKLLLSHRQTTAKSQRNAAGTNGDSVTGTQDGFLSDEVDGLLLSLGVAPTSTDAAKIKAMETERQRLAACNDQDSASEVAGLIAWKLKTTKIIGKCGDVPSAGDGIASGDQLERYAGKFRYALDLYPACFKANLHLGRVLLTQSKPQDAIPLLRSAVAVCSTSIEARFLLGYAMLLDTKNVETALFLLDPIFTSFCLAGPSQVLSESIIFMGSALFQKAWLASAKTHAGLGRLEKAQNELSALASLLARHLAETCTGRHRLTSKFFAQSALILVNTLLELLKLEKSRDSPIQNVKSSILFLLGQLSESLDEEKKAEIDLDGHRIGVFRVLVCAERYNPYNTARLGSALLEKYDRSQKQTEATLMEIETVYQCSIDSETHSRASVDARLSGHDWFQTEFYHERSTTSVTDKKEKRPVVGKMPPATKSQPNTKSAPAPSKSKPVIAKAPVVKASPVKAKPTTVTAKPASNQAKTPGPSKAAPSAAAKAQAPKPTPGVMKPAPASSGPNIKTHVPDKSVNPSENATLSVEAPSNNEPVIQPLSESRLGLARVYSRLSVCQGSKKVDPRVEKMYLEALGVDNSVQDVYIELANHYEHTEKNIEKAADILMKYPFDSGDSVSQDQLFLYGEIARIFVKIGRFKDPILCESLVALGRAGGTKAIEMWVEAMDKSGDCAKELMHIFASIGRKSVEDPDMQAFFKAKFWI